MNDLTKYAKAVDRAANLVEAQQAMEVLLNQFKHKSKVKLFEKYTQMKGSKSRLQKWAWDLVLVGFNERVI